MLGQSSLLEHSLQTMNQLSYIIWYLVAQESLSTIKQKEFIAKIREKCPNGFHLILICYKLSDREDDALFRSLKMLAGVFGNELWARAIFVLTFANVFLLQKENKYVTEVEEVREAIIQEKRPILPRVYTTVFRSWLQDQRKITNCQLHSASDGRPFLSEIATHQLQIEIAAIGIGIVTGGFN